MEVETKLPTKRKVLAWRKLGLRAPLVAGRLLDQIFFPHNLTLGFFICQTTTGRFEKWGGRQFYTKYDLLAKGFLVSPRLIFRPRGVVPYIVYMGMCGSKGYGFQTFWYEIAYQFRPFWSEIGYRLCTLVLNWVCFLEELPTSLSFGDSNVSLLIFTPTTVYVL